MNKEIISYTLIRALVFPARWMPYSWIHRIGKVVGRAAFYFLSNYRKRTLSNLALAKSLDLNNEQIVETAKQSFGNLAINCLEYAKIAADKKLFQTVQCQNPEVANELHAKGKGIVFFCAHQANWELLFLDGTTRMKGVAIAKESKNKKLYNWIVSIREQYGGKIIPQQSGLKEGLRALKAGAFLGIVGDQGAPGSGYSFPFFGRTAWTSTAPALLAYKTNCPIIFAQIRRIAGKYQIHYSDPIWPDRKRPLEHEIVHMMDKTLTLLQDSIKEQPNQWLWQHNRWKQQTPRNLYKEFRYDAICVILPPDKVQFDEINPHLETLKSLYPTELFHLISKKGNIPSIHGDEIIYYENIDETLIEDYRFKLVFNFTDYKSIKKHYLRLSAFHVFNIDQLTKRAAPFLPKEYTLADVFKQAICRQKENHAS